MILFFGKFVLSTNMLFFRLLVGMGLGYALTRGAGGFAGSINRAYNSGSTKLMRALMFLFFITAVLTAAFIHKDPTAFGLWVNPINLGLILGGILFGFGMSFSACCASGVLTDLTEGFPRAFITLIFFGMGIFLGFPIQSGMSFVTDSWFSSASYGNGVFLPDLFKWDGLNGYLGAILLTGAIALFVTALVYLYEQKRKKANTYHVLPNEIKEDRVDPIDTENFELLSETTYDRFFVKAWNLKTAMVVIAILFALLMGVTGSGWGASTPYGMWFGKFLMLFGVSAESLANFTTKPVEFFTIPLLEHGVTMQNFGILLGATFFLLTSGRFKDTFLGGFKISTKLGLLYALGGFSMGLGTRLANGCNVGALYTPIANFSLSGWVFLVVMVIGGILGNTFAKKVGSDA
ncbi:MAG: YeeE/YedE family protein [Tetragenococcus halophilus]|nr:YeeE/YedE family protein [Tetragenococcus halophilus]